MKLAQTYLNAKIIVAGIIAATLILGLSGCGNPERQNARQKFKEAIAATKVRAQSSTYAEFRQAELDLKTSYEINKAYLDDVSYQFSDLVTVMQATDDCWSRYVSYPDVPIIPSDKDKAWHALLLLSPEMSAKSNLPKNQIWDDPDFNPMKHVRKGLTKISDESDALLSAIEANK